MKKLDEQESGSGQKQESKNKPSLVASKPMTNETEGSKGPDEEPLQKSLTPKQKKSQKSFSENENGNGVETTPPKKAKSLMPVPKLSSPSKDGRAELALKRLKIKDKDLLAAPPITALIKTTVKGGLKVALEAMRFAMGDPEIRDFFKKYDSIPPSDLERLSWEAICIAAKVNPIHLLGAVQLAVATYCGNKSRFIAVSNHPDITKKRVEFAKMAGGEKDRTALDIMNGALASPKGPTFIGHATFGHGGGAAKNDDGEDIPTAQVVYQGGDIEDRIFGTPEATAELDNKLVKIRDRRLEGF
jgi:hypothetical protein